MTLIEYVLTVAFFILLGYATIAGLNIIRKYKPDFQVQFYMVMSVIRFTLVALIILAHTLLTDNRNHAISFALIFLAEYLVMMAITLTIIWKRK